ncbi:MAG: di-heme oxidoredictase family protein [Bacteroidota bacterium]
MNKKLLPILIMSLSVFSCANDDVMITDVAVPTVEEGEELSSGDLGLNITGSDAFGFSIFGLDISGISQFQQGNSLFNQSWVMATEDPMRMDDGLGPTFNAISCSSCHFADGRGRPLINGQNSVGFLIRVSNPGQDQFGGPLGVPGYNSQIQDLAIEGVAPEAKVTVTYEMVDGTYPDGTAYQLRRPIYNFNDEQFGSLAGVQTSPRVGQQTIGMGLISALPDSEILKFADEFDSDGDGISGRPNRVWNFETNTVGLGKYGWKANVPTLKSQVASAFHGDMGLTNPVFSSVDCPSPQQDCIDSPSGGTPEISEDQLEKVVFYQATLVVPNRRNVSNESVLFGRDRFREINCIGCHSVNQVTGSSDVSPLLENVTIRPYSDFLLHDMGSDLADNRPDFVANGSEWRTQPLWGIGLISDVNDHTFLLHDGRARNIEEAILWHGGEAQASKEAFMQLSSEQRQQVLDFVNSL